MKEFDSHIKRITEQFTKELNILLRINSIDWVNLKRDEIVICSSYFKGFMDNRDVDRRHFNGISSNAKFVVYENGKSSGTTSKLDTYEFALPIKDYEELVTGVKNVQ